MLVQAFYIVHTSGARTRVQKVKPKVAEIEGAIRRQIKKSKIEILNFVAKVIDNDLATEMDVL